MTEPTPPTADVPLTGLHDFPATIKERKAAGKAARQRVAPGAQGHWDETARGHDALATLASQNLVRVPDLVPLRYGRMAVSPWNYYRGAAAVMAADLASQPHSGLEVQLCGDAHVLNFGLWATPERNLLFDLRDFDETHPGPFEWDHRRLRGGLVVAARAWGTKARPPEAGVVAPASAYRKRMSGYVDAPELDIWYDKINVYNLVRFFKPADRGLVSIHIEREARVRTSLGAFAKLTSMVNGRPRIDENPPVRVTIDDDEQADLVDQLFAGYRLTMHEGRRQLFDRFTLVDVVRQVVGVGSVGMRVYLVLLEGRSGDDPLFLQVKQAAASVYEAHTQPGRHENNGQRVISGKRALQSATDIFAGWGSLRGRDYYVRQFRDMKIIPTIELLGPYLIEIATACGEALAKAHGCTGDPAAISAYIGKGKKFDQGIGNFARLYADQNDRDHAQLAAAIAAGTIESRSDS